MFIRSIILGSLIMFSAFAEDVSDKINYETYQTVDEIREKYMAEHPTDCAHRIFYRSLEDAAAELESDEDGEPIDYLDESFLEMWAQTVMLNERVLEQVRQCPEVANIKETDTVIFSPVKYTFPWGQSVTVNYSTQPKVITQKLELARKPSLPTSSPNPKLGDPDDVGAKYINTSPAWYAIMVVQHDTLKNYVGEGKNNLLSMKWINDNIDYIYPKGYFCTSRSAWANDTDHINKVVHEVVNMDNDDNDYYVAGNIDLSWVAYAEIVMDVVLMVATLGTTEAASAGFRAMKIVKNIKNLAKGMSKLGKLEHVAKYFKKADKLAKTMEKYERLSKNIKNAEKYEKLYQKSLKLQKGSKELAKVERDMQKVFQNARKLDPKISKNMLKNPKKMAKNVETLSKEAADLSKEASKILDDVAKEIKNTEKLHKEAKNAEEAAKYAKELDNLKDIQNYAKDANALQDMLKMMHDLKALGRPQTGNVISRTFKTIKDSYRFNRVLHGTKNAKKLKQATKMARSGMGTFSSKAKDWLFHTSLKFGDKIVRFEQKVGALAGMMYIIGDFYDATSTTSQKYTNGIEFKPYCLLSADDLEGQENEVNYGMWLMWTGNSSLPEDDDAAYLQALDFASKFVDKLNDYQEVHGQDCNVDVYIVRPIIRLNESNPDKTEGDLFYLFMNEEPWTTAENFIKAHPDIAAWEAQQEEFERTDSRNKYERLRKAQEAKQQAANAANSNSSNNSTATPNNQ